MKERMNWNKLLSNKRVSDFDECGIASKKSQFVDPRSSFEKDFDQITFSYPFRRLQDKTQVIPFPKFDFVHTRLTHSLEVASVGRSFGKLVADLIFKELDEKTLKSLNICNSDIGALIAASCLAHDIGNPPFGHSGEDSISHYFIRNDHNFKPNLEEEDGKYFKSEYVRNQETRDLTQNKYEIPKNLALTSIKRYKDLSNFEGNANGFRIITQNCSRGINPTLALLGTFTKYPRESFLEKNPFDGFKKSEKPKSQSKYGFFQEQKKLFEFVAQEVGLIKVKDIGDNDTAYYRHPLAFLMEASDDIAYGIIDFEDGCRLGLIDFDKQYSSIRLRNKSNKLETVKINKSSREILIEIAILDDAFSNEKLNSFSDFKQEISYLRSKVINVIIHQCFDVFKNEYENIMTGKFDKALIDCIENKSIKENLNLMGTLVRKYVYQYAPVLESEASGFEVMEHLINSFAITSNICYSCGNEETARDRKMRSLLPVEFQPENEKEIENLSDDEKYERVLKVLDYISGMTDKYAVNLYRKIKGIEI
jgi:dGTPase